MFITQMSSVTDNLIIMIKIILNILVKKFSSFKSLVATFEFFDRSMSSYYNWHFAISDTGGWRMKFLVNLFKVNSLSNYKFG